MGALKGTVTVRRYLVKGDPPGEQSRIVKAVRAHALAPIDPKGVEERSIGWANVEDPQDLELSSEKIFFGECLALALRVDTLKPPAALVRRMVEQGLRALGRRPNKAEKRAYKEEVVRKLRDKVFPTVRATDMVWLLDTGRVLFWSHGKGANEQLVDLFARTFSLELVPDGPTQAARRVGSLPAGLGPTPEMVVGFPGLPGRAMEEDDDA